MVIVQDRTDDEVDLDIIHENLKREDLDPIAEAREYQHLIDKGNSQSSVAEKVGKVQSNVAETLILLKLPEEVQQLISREIISKKHGVYISKIKEDEVKKAFASFIVKMEMPVSQVKMMLDIYDGGGAAALMGNLGLTVEPSPSEGEGQGEGDGEAASSAKKKSKGKKVSGAGAGGSALWPGLPEGVKFKSQGGRHTLSWPSGKYNKALVEALFHSAPEAIQVKKKGSKAAGEGSANQKGEGSASPVPSEVAASN
jgi:ParB-like chromosome segregation protein Spo0J